MKTFQSAATLGAVEEDIPKRGYALKPRDDAIVLDARE